jgi:hypothetical protein
MDLSPGIETTPLRELELKARITVGLGFKDICNTFVCASIN